MNILLAVSGSIAAYKSYDILRIYLSQGHQVKVVLSKGAMHFIRPELFKYLGAQDIYTHEDDFKNFEGEKSNVLHIELARWCDRFILAPASANTLAKLSCGLADDLLSCLFLSLDQKTPKILYPAMNTKMLENPITKKNITTLATLPQCFIHPPQMGSLACGEMGAGKFPPVEIVAHSALAFNQISTQSKNILITTGATRSYLDPIRYLTNASTGKTGFELAKYFLSQGHKVKVIAGIEATKELDFFKELPSFDLIRVTSPNNMFEAVKKSLADADIYISSAAISDIEFEYSKEKIKKKNLTGQSFSCKSSQDILKYVIENKNPHQTIIGFAAETKLSDKIIKDKLKNKPVDFLVVTEVGMQKGFGETDPIYKIFKGEQLFYQGKLSKNCLGEKLSTQFLN